MSFHLPVFRNALPIFRHLGLTVSRRLIVLALLAAVSGAWAQPGDNQVNDEFTDLSLKELTEMEVFSSASLLPTERTKAPGTVYSFDRKDFERLGVRRIDDLLAYVPGFQVAQNRKRHRSIWARGLVDRFNDKLVLMVDGIRRQHVYYGNFSLGDNFPLEKIEKVEIILGPASTLYGANAFGGIISVTTRNFTKNQQVDATAEGGDNARGKGTLLYNSEQFQAFGSYLSQDAPFREDRKSFIGGDTLQPLDEDYANLFLKASPVEGLTLSADYYRNNNPFLFIPNTQNSFVEEDSLTLTALYEKGDLEQGKIQANFYYTWDKAREYEKEQRTQRLGYDERQDAAMAGSTITGFKRLFDDHTLALGLNWMHTAATDMDFERRFHFSRGFLNPPETGSLLADPNVSNDDYAVFIQDVWNIHPQLDLTLGGRFDHFEQFGSHFNYRAALVYTPDERQTVKLLYGTAMRTPTFREYLKVLDGTDFVAPVPDPERIRSVELGYIYQWDRGGNQFTFFSADMNARAERRLALETKLRQAIRESALSIHYQPRCDTVSLEIVGFEALVRWNDAEEGPIAPAEFIPLAEECGLIASIDEWVLETACREMLSWCIDADRDIRLSVNLSPAQFIREDLHLVISEILQRTGFPGTKLELEITESLFGPGNASACKVLELVRELGIEVSIDDFGTGYSSLSRLKQLPLQTLKIDQSFVRDLGQDPDDETLVRTIIAMAHNLNLKVVAEGVETQLQYDYVKHYRCDAVQGFLFGRPVPCDQIPQMLNNRDRVRRMKCLPI